MVNLRILTPKLWVVLPRILTAENSSLRKIQTALLALILLNFPSTLWTQRESQPPAKVWSIVKEDGQLRLTQLSPLIRRSTPKSCTEIQLLVSLKPPKTWLAQPINASSKTTRLIYSKNISMVSKLKISPSPSRSKLKWFLRTPTASRGPPPGLFGTQIPANWEQVSVMPCSVSNRCLKTCRVNLTFGILQILTSLRKHFFHPLHSVVWPSTTRTQIQS